MPPDWPGPMLGFTFFVQRKVPTHNRASPILQHAGEGRCPFTPIGLEVRAGNDRAAFGPLRMLIGKGVVYTGHGVDGTVVCMPCDAVHISVDLWVAELIKHASPQIVVVIEYPDLGVERSALQGGAQMVRHEPLFVFLSPTRTPACG